MKPIEVCMRTHRHDQAIQKAALHLLRYDKCTLARLLATEEDFRIARAVCKAIKHGVEHDGIVKDGLQVLLAIEEALVEQNDETQIDKFYDDCIRAKILSTLMQCLELHANVFCIVQRAFIVLGNVLGGSPDVTRCNELFNSSHCRRFCTSTESHVGRTVKQAYNIQKQKNRARAEDKLKALKRRIRCLVEGWRKQDDESRHDKDE